MVTKCTETKSQAKVQHINQLVHTLIPQVIRHMYAEVVVAEFLNMGECDEGKGECDEGKGERDDHCLELDRWLQPYKSFDSFFLSVLQQPL